MDSREQTAVRKIWTKLIKGLDPKHSVLDYLFENGEDSGIFREEYEHILYRPTRLDRAQALLVQVLRTCPIATFIRALEYEDAYLHLAEMIRHSLKATADQNASESTSLSIEVPKATSERKPLREKQVSQNPCTPCLVISEAQWENFKEDLLETVEAAIESNFKMPTGLKRSYVEDDEENSTHPPMAPREIPTKRLNSGAGHGFYRYMSRILQDLEEKQSAKIIQKTDTVSIKNLNNSTVFVNSTTYTHSDQRPSTAPALEKRAEEGRMDELEFAGTVVPPCSQDPEEVLPEFDRLDIFDTMQNTMLHDPDGDGKWKYPCVTFGIIIVNGGKAEILRRDDSLHWEEKAIRHLMDEIQRRKIQGPELRMVFYTNWSPCPSCVRSILCFLEWSKRKGLCVNLKIKVAALYNITWPECEARGCQHLWFSRKYHKDDHQQGIETLFQRGVSVEAFTEKSWRIIRKSLKLPLADCPYTISRENTDDMVRLSLLAIKKLAC